MRRRLILVSLATSTLITLAFVVPLGFLVRRTAEDRATDAARADAQAVVPALVAAPDPDSVTGAMLSTTAGIEGRMTIVLSDGTVLGTPVVSERLDRALERGASSIGPTADGQEVVLAVASGPDEISAVRVHVPNDVLRSGTARAWAVLAVVGVTLISISVLVADRLSRSVTGPTARLASAARRLGAGELDTVVAVEGPAELVELGQTFNELGAQVGDMLARERELVAELSHRLRTPLTKLRLRIDAVDDPDLAAALQADLAELTESVSEVIREARRDTATRAGCDAAAVLGDRARFWQVLADDQGRSWQTDLTEEPCPVAVSAADLAATADVLIENVFAHTPESAAVRISVQRDGTDVVIEVADGGPGIEPDAADRGVSGAGSTGLGLDIARSLAVSAGGSFAIGRGELGGATVTVRLPLRPERAGSRV